MLSVCSLSVLAGDVPTIIGPDATSFPLTYTGGAQGYLQSIGLPPCTHMQGHSPTAFPYARGRSPLVCSYKHTCEVCLCSQESVHTFHGCLLSPQFEGKSQCATKPSTFHCRSCAELQSPTKNAACAFLTYSAIQCHSFSVHSTQPQTARGWLRSLPYAERQRLPAQINLR